MIIDSCGIFYLTNIKCCFKKDFKGIHFDDPIRKSIHLSVIRLSPLLRIAEQIPLEMFNFLYKAIINESFLSFKLIDPSDLPVQRMFNHLLLAYQSENPKEALLSRFRLGANHLVFDE